MPTQTQEVKRLTPAFIEEQKERINSLLKANQANIPLLEDNTRNRELTDGEVITSVRAKVRAEQKVVALKVSLERIKNDRYGICLSCGHEIATERLKAVPETTICTDCIQKK